MKNNSLERQWKDLISHQIKRIAQHQDNSDISIQIQPQANKIKKNDNADNNVLTFWLNRKKFRNEEKVINLDDNKPQIGKALNSINYNTFTNKSIQPIGSHRKQREKQTVVPIINLQNNHRKRQGIEYKSKCSNLLYEQARKTSTLRSLLSAQYEYLNRIGDNRKIMICAPSNAAVDHIVKRIRNQGLFNGDGEIIKPNILRVGIVDSEDPDILQVYLDNLCEKKMIEQQQNAKILTFY